MNYKALSKLFLSGILLEHLSFRATMTTVGVDILALITYGSYQNDPLIIELVADGLFMKIFQLEIPWVYVRTPVEPVKPIKNELLLIPSHSENLNGV